VESFLDPFVAIDAWMAEAARTEPDVPDAMQLATVGPDGAPSIRTVLLKQWGPDALVFFTNYDGRKAGQLDGAGVAAVCIHHKSLQRQILAEGPVERASDAASDAYWATRPRGSQIGAWASPQSRPLRDRAELLDRVAEFEARFAGADVPRPGPTGAAIACSRTGSSCGRDGPIDCMTGCCFFGTRAGGDGSGSPPDVTRRRGARTRSRPTDARSVRRAGRGTAPSGCGTRARAPR
jgi:pyridoxamine 5'-phosphate oxidase